MIGRYRSAIARMFPGVARRYADARILLHGIRSRGWRHIRRNDTAPIKQLGFTFACDLTFDANLPEELRRRNVQFSEGRHAIYLPPQAQLAEIFDFGGGIYPEKSGVKILRDFRSPAESHYLAPDKQTNARRSIVGTHTEQLRVANYLNELSLGPAAYDVCELTGAKGTTATAFIVAHAPGKNSDAVGCEQFTAHLKTILESDPHLFVTIPNWTVSSDFKPPSCNGNLLVDSDGKWQYVDFQNFGVRNAQEFVMDALAEGQEDLHFGHTRSYRGGRYLYQSVPGIAMSAKRDSSERWKLFRRGLQEAGVSLDRKFCLDIGCNSGIMMQHALASGAAWAFGWDRASVVSRSRILAQRTGFTRTTFWGGDLHEGYAFSDDLPQHVRANTQDVVVFFLALREHIGVPRDLSNPFWSALVYEGHQRETLDDARRYLQPIIESGAKIRFETEISDGDSYSRPFMILTR